MPVYVHPLDDPHPTSQRQTRQTLIAGLVMALILFGLILIATANSGDDEQSGGAATAVGAADVTHAQSG